MKILLIDDDKLMLSLVKTSLERRGHTVTIAERAESGLETAASDPPEVILLDWHLPGTHGSEAIRQFQENPRTKDVPVLFFTGRLDAGNESEIKNLGARGIIRKPIIPSELPDQIREALA